MKILIAPAILMLAASTARADQCELVTPDVAEKAQQLLATHPNVISFCEPCGEQAPGLPTPAASVFILRSRHVGASAEVSINDASVDLAYTYVQTSPTRYENLALLAGCEAQDVSPSLTVGDETKNGVLIVPSTEPAVQPIVPASASEDPLVESYLPRATVPPPPSIVVVESSRRPLWLAAGIAGLLGGCASFTGVLVLATTRRRRKRALLPRAVDLPLE